MGLYLSPLGMYVRMCPFVCVCVCVCVCVRVWARAALLKYLNNSAQWWPLFCQHCWG